MSYIRVELVSFFWAIFRSVFAIKWHKNFPYIAHVRSERQCVCLYFWVPRLNFWIPRLFTGSLNRTAISSVCRYLQCSIPIISPGWYIINPLRIMPSRNFSEKFSNLSGSHMWFSRFRRKVNMTEHSPSWTVLIDVLGCKKNWNNDCRVYQVHNHLTTYAHKLLELF